MFFKLNQTEMILSKGQKPDQKDACSEKDRGRIVKKSHIRFNSRSISDTPVTLSVRIKTNLQLLKILYNPVYQYYK